MSITAITFIREDSKRLPRKSIKNLFDKPLFLYSFEKFSKNKNIDRCIAYTNSKIVKSQTKKLLSKNTTTEVISRPAYLDGDVTFNEIMESFIDRINTEYVLYFCVTSPFISDSTITDVTNKVLMNNKFDSSFTAKEVKSFCWYKGKPLNYNLDKKIPFTQDLKPVLVETSGFYLFKKSLFLEQKRRIGQNPYIKVIDEIEGHDIDYHEDFVLAESFLSSGLVK